MVVTMGIGTEDYGVQKKKKEAFTFYVMSPFF